MGHALVAAAILHLAAGVIAGSVFSVQTLLLIVALVLLECAGVAVTMDLASGLWSLQLLVAVQLGYLAGIYLRSLAEQRGISVAKPDAQSRRRL